MSYEEIELHMVYGTDPSGRTRECCGNCGDFLQNTYHVVDARLASGRRIENHICEECLIELARVTEALNIPLQVLDDVPDDMKPREPMP